MTSQSRLEHIPICIGLIAVAGWTGLIGLDSTIAEQDLSQHWLTGPKLQQELDRQFSASWTRAELRQMLQDVAANRHVSIVLDRRLDPTAQLPFEVNEVSLRGGLKEFADLAKGDLSLPGNYIYLGPAKTVRQLRTLIELRKRELSSKEVKISERRRSEFLKPQTVQWQDLDSPKDILKKTAATSHLTIANPDQIPHDLWAASVLPEVTVIEALSVVLIQFDLTFRWSDSGAGIELVAIQDEPSFERRFSSKQNPAETLNLVKQKLPNVDAKLVRSEIAVNGTVEDHEAVAHLLHGNSARPPEKPERSTPIRQRLFTFSVEQPVPVSAIIRKLEESDIHFDYNVDQLKAAGIDLEQTVQPDVTNATADEFFKAIFGPVGLEFQFERQSVKLKPKKSTTRPQ